MIFVYDSYDGQDPGGGLAPRQVNDALHNIPTYSFILMLDRKDALCKVVTDATAVGVVGHLSRQEEDHIEDVIDVEGS